MKSIIVLLLLATLSPTAFATHPDCSGVSRWPTMTAFVHLRNKSITDSEKLDHSKTTTERLASEKIGKDLFRQVHLIKFIEKSGNVIDVITVSDASIEECSMSSVDVFVVKEKIIGR